MEGEDTALESLEMEPRDPRKRKSGMFKVFTHDNFLFTISVKSKLFVMDYPN